MKQRCSLFENVFIFLQKCQLQAAEIGWSLAWTQLEKLFSYFRDIFHCIRPAGSHIAEAA